MLGQEEDEGWEVVTSKKKRLQSGGRNVTDVASNARRIMAKDTVSFYFSEFPDTHGAKDMLRAFNHYGDAMEVVIPPKRDKRGRRFGFVRFCNVRDPRVFAVKLDNIIIGAKKIHVNLPRFQREWVEDRRAPRGQVQAKEKHDVQHGHIHKVRKVWRKKEERRREEVRVNYNPVNARRGVHQVGNPGPPMIVYHRKKNVSEVCYNVSEEEMEKFNKMYVGVVYTPGSTYSAQEWFSMQGVFSIKVTPLGANKVLLEEMEEGIMAALLDDASGWIYEKFEDVRLWSAAEADNERVILVSK